MQALSGNSNDTKAFAQTVRRHLSCLKAAQESRYLVGDAALYCAETCGRNDRGRTTGRAGQRLSWPLAACRLCWCAAALVAGTQRASYREQQTLAKNLLQDSTRELKAFAKLCSQRFACQADAQAELSRFSASLMLLQLDAEVQSEPVYAG